LAGEFGSKLATEAIKHVVRGERTLPDTHIEELPAAGLIPDDEAGFPGGFSVEQNLCRADGLCFSEASSADYDACYRTSKIKNNLFSDGQR